MPSTRRALVFVSIVLLVAAAACFGSRTQWGAALLDRWRPRQGEFTLSSGPWMNDTRCKWPREKAPDGLA